MSEHLYFPAILSVSLAPNPVGLGVPVLVSVLAADLEGAPEPMVWRSGEIRCGEV